MVMHAGAMRAKELVLSVPSIHVGTAALLVTQLWEDEAGRSQELASQFS